MHLTENTVMFMLHCIEVPAGTANTVLQGRCQHSKLTLPGVPGGPHADANEQPVTSTHREATALSTVSSYLVDAVSSTDVSFDVESRSSLGS